MTCDLNFIVKVEGLFRVTSSHILWKSGNILETVLDGDVVTGRYHFMSIISHIWPI